MDISIEKLRWQETDGLVISITEKSRNYPSKFFGLINLRDYSM